MSVPTTNLLVVDRLNGLSNAALVQRVAGGQIEQTGAAPLGALGPHEAVRTFYSRALASRLEDAAEIWCSLVRIGEADNPINAGFGTIQAKDAGTWKIPQMITAYARPFGPGQSVLADLSVTEFHREG